MRRPSGESAQETLAIAAFALERRDAAVLAAYCDSESLEQCKRGRMLLAEDMQFRIAHGLLDREVLLRFLHFYSVRETADIAQLSLLSLVEGSFRSLVGAPPAHIEVEGHVVEVGEGRALGAVRVATCGLGRVSDVTLRHMEGRWGVIAQPLTPWILPGFDGLVVQW